MSAQELLYLKSKGTLIELRLTELWLIREVEADLWKPNFQECYPSFSELSRKVQKW
jgi:hypothetical protein